MPPHDLKFDVLRFRAAAPGPVEFKAEPSGLIAGLASSFSTEPDRVGDRVKPGAFRKTLKSHTDSGTMPAMCWQHSPEIVVGRWTTMQETALGLEVRGQVNLKTGAGRDAFEHVLAGDARWLSIGYNTPDGGRTYDGKGVWTLSEVDLIEVSIVSAPADRKARITEVKSLGSKAELIDALRDVGLSKAAAARVAAGGWPALAGVDDDTEHATRLAALIERATAEIKGL